MAIRNLKELQEQVDSLSPEEQAQLALYLAAKAKSREIGVTPNGAELMRFFGKIDFKGEPLDIQRKTRAEWPN